MAESLQHLFLVRHGESEGDVRRAAWKRGEKPKATKSPDDEELTEAGELQSKQAGLWIAQHVLAKLIPGGIDVHYVSQSLRSEQTAAAMELPTTIWQSTELLNERNRGDIRGVHSDLHREKYPDSFMQMQQAPLDWLPPGGESMRQVVWRTNNLLDNTQYHQSVLAVTHRDLIWGAMKAIEGLTDDQWLNVDTEGIGNANILHYTSINPETGQPSSALHWKRLIDPTVDSGDIGWQRIAGNPPLGDSLDDYFVIAES